MSSWQQISDDARVWVYQADRFLSDDESTQLLLSATEFVKEWSSHGSGLLASAHVFHNAFLVLFVDESQVGASGCSIDKSVRFVKQMEVELSVGFFDRLKICMLQDNQMKLLPLSNLGDVKEDAQFFDNTVRDKKSLIDRWLVPVAGSWLDRYVEVGA